MYMGMHMGMYIGAHIYDPYRCAETRASAAGVSRLLKVKRPHDGTAVVPRVTLDDGSATGRDTRAACEYSAGTSTPLHPRTLANPLKGRMRTP